MTMENQESLIIRLFLGDAKEAFYLDAQTGAYYLLSFENGELCIFSDVNKDKFAFTTCDDTGNVLEPENTRFPTFYGWPDSCNWNGGILNIMWEGDQHLSLESVNTANWVSLQVPQFPQSAYSN